MEIVFAGGAIGLGDAPDYANLPLHVWPVKHQASLRMLAQLRTFIRIVVGKEHEPALVEMFEQHDSRGHLFGLAIVGRQSHRV